MAISLIYSGEEPLTPAEIAAGHRPYLPEPGLVEAVNLAILLERPLLLAGPLGCGKSGLAPAVARALRLPCHVWRIKSTSKAREGLYSFDAVARLRDAHLPRREGDERIDDNAYVRYGPLGKAFLSPQQSVVMIREIDNADIDFPNDLLIELDELRFKVLELNAWKTAVSSPIIIVTSSMAKALPEAFLRRCVYYYLDFPSPERLLRIMASSYPEINPYELEAALFNAKRPAPRS